MSDIEETNAGPAKFDSSAYPADSLFHERRDRLDRRGQAPPTPTLAPGKAPERRARQERRRRIDPTTFEKQYTNDELEFMNAMQRYKVASGKAFPSYGDVLRVALSLGYRRLVEDDDEPSCDHEEEPTPNRLQIQASPPELTVV